MHQISLKGPRQADQLGQITATWPGPFEREQPRAKKSFQGRSLATTLEARHGKKPFSHRSMAVKFGSPTVDPLVPGNHVFLAEILGQVNVEAPQQMEAGSRKLF
ncbi:MAG: hypothetical protein ACYTHJ_09480 [Planctomycetota bacterium]